MRSYTVKKKHISLPVSEILRHTHRETFLLFIYNKKGRSILIKNIRPYFESYHLKSCILKETSMQWSIFKNFYPTCVYLKFENCPKIKPISWLSVQYIYFINSQFSQAQLMYFVCFIYNGIHEPIGHSFCLLVNQFVIQTVYQITLSFKLIFKLTTLNQFAIHFVNF